MNSILSLVLIALTSVACAQQGNVTITKDSRIDRLVYHQGAIIPPATTPQIEGYRIQLFFDSDRGALNEARTRFFAQHPRIDTYITYIAPNFFLHAGDFRTRMEAEKVKAAIQKQFPTCFIIRDKINLPRLSKE